MSEVSPKVSDLLNRLNINAEVFDRGLGSLQRAPLAALKDLRIAYSKALVETNKFAAATSDGRVNLPPFCYNPLPQAALTSLRRLLAKTYFQTAEAKHDSALDLGRLLTTRTRRSAMLQRLVNENVHVRGSFEKIAGGTVVLDGRMDGTISMREQSQKPVAQSGSVGVSTSALTGGAPSSGVINVGGASAGGVPPPTSPPSPMPENMDQLLMAMDQAVLNAAQSMRSGYGSYEASKGSMSSLVDGPFPTSGSSSGLSDGSDSSDSSSSGASFALTSGSTLPFPQNNLPEANGGNGKNPTSVDLGTLQLQRLLTKRDQMYDLVRTVFDKYNQNAMATINNMKA